MIIKYNRKIKITNLIQFSSASPTQWDAIATYRNERIYLYIRYRSNVLTVMRVPKIVCTTPEILMQYDQNETLFMSAIPNHADDSLSEKSLVLFTKHLIDWRSYLHNLQSK